MRQVGQSAKASGVRGICWQHGTFWDGRCLEAKCVYRRNPWKRSRSDSCNSLKREALTLSSRHSANPVAAAFTLSLVVSFAVSIPVACAQTESSLQFEVASIKRNNSGDTERYIRPAPGRLSIRNMTLKNLVTIAYGIREFQLSGGPGWIESEAYDIEATSDARATPPQLTGLMLQSLLKERFNLAVSTVSRELPIYAMTVAKTGPTLQRSPDQTCLPFDPANPPLPGDPGRKPNEMCGSIGLGLTSLNAKQATMPALAMALSQLLGRTVVDRTNLAGEFDGRLTFAPTGFVPNGASVDPALPDIFTAVQEQFGLRLEASIGPVGTIFIDQVERPTEN